MLQTASVVYPSLQAAMIELQGASVAVQRTGPGRGSKMNRAGKLRSLAWIDAAGREYITALLHCHGLLQRFGVCLLSYDVVEGEIALHLALHGHNQPV